MGTILTGDQKLMLGAKLAELSRQIFLQKEYGFDPEKLNAFLQRAVEGKWSSNSRWIKKGGVVYFTLISNGKTGEEWITHFEGKGLPVCDYTKSILRHEDFKPTEAGTVHNIAVINGEVFSDGDRTTKYIRSCAKNQKMTNLPAEAACLICDNFTDKKIKEMGLTWIITMHDPILDSDGDFAVLGTGHSDDCRFFACCGESDGRWSRDRGFAFATKKCLWFD